MNRLAGVLGILLLLSGGTTCASRAPIQTYDSRFEGTYRGMIELTGPVRAGDPTPRRGPVEIRFTQGGYSVKGDVRYLPPTGHGAYELGDQLILVDNGFHSAEFDWTLILKGAFDLTWNGDDLRMEQTDSLGHHWLITVTKIP